MADMDLKIFSGPGIEGLNKSNASRIYFYSFVSKKTFWFNAFLTDFADSYKSNWTQQEIYGRMDPISTFKNTTRKIDCNIDIPSYSIDEAIRNTYYIDVLISSLYPVYKKESSGARGTYILSTPPLFRVRFGDFIRERGAGGEAQNSKEYTVADGLMCYFDGFNYSPNAEAGFFIQGRSSANNGSERIYPKLLKASFSMNIIHQKPLGYEYVNNKLVNRTTGDNNDELYNHINGSSYNAATANYIPKPAPGTTVSTTDAKKPTFTNIE